MPYRISPRDKKVVQQKKAGKWKNLKIHKTPTEARKHLQALVLNVEK